MATSRPRRIKGRMKKASPLSGGVAGRAAGVPSERAEHDHGAEEPAAWAAQSDHGATEAFYAFQLPANSW